MIQQDLLAIKQRFGIIGTNPNLHRAIEIAVQVARTDLSVLITGESGVGKEHFPKIIHNYSARKHGKYFAINCGAIPEGTIDSELFGHERGAFTDAKAEHQGYFEIADGGTLFLDEVGELPLQTQVRLLRVLETGEFIRMGSSKVQKTNVRVVAATNLDMKKAIEEAKAGIKNGDGGPFGAVIVKDNKIIAIYLVHSISYTNTTSLNLNIFFILR